MAAADALTLRAHAQELASLPPLAADVDTSRVGEYHGYGQLVSRWAALEAAGARATRVGTSVGGNPLFAFEIGPSDAPATSTVMAGIHPIEWIGVETMLAILDRLVAAPPRDRRVVAFPLINVDGYRLVERDLRSGRRRFIRSNKHGVDLNRNWRTHFKTRRRLGGVLAGWNYGGPTPASEPEIEAVVGMLDEAAEASTIDAALSLHSFGRMILFPYGGKVRRAERFDELQREAQALQDRLRFRYRLGQSSRWVPGLRAHGMEIDHLHAEYGAIALLVECSSGGLSLRDPSSWTHPFRWFNPPDPAREADAIADAVLPFINPG